MLEAIRSHAQGWLAKLILALITLPFAFWGIDSYFGADSRNELVARVGDGGVTREGFTEALKEQAERMRQALGPNFDPAATETREFREQVLNGLAEQEALIMEAEAAGLHVSDAKIAAILHQIPAFQVDGKFSPERYKKLLEKQGYTPRSFQNSLYRDLLLQLYQQPVSAATLVSANVIDRVALIAGQRREISWTEITPAAVASQVSISDQDIKQYYDTHKKDFTNPEAVRIEYLVLSLEKLADGIQISDQQVQEYYKANASKLGPPEERSASHILLAAASGDATARKQARTKAEALMTAIGKAPKSFAEVARRESQDPGSAQLGGSLDSFARGRMSSRSKKPCSP